MRVIHTSDWHLGRSLHGEDLLGAQAAFVDFLVDTVRAERVEAVVMSGDIYDRALPPVDAVTVFDDALRRLRAAGARVVLISGNHDSARRLGFGAELVDHAGVHLRTDHRRIGEPVLLADRHGLVAVHGLPYLEPELVRADLGCEGGRGHAPVLRAAMTAVRRDLLARPPGTRSVVLAHAFVVGGRTSESERDISVGGVACVPIDVFDGVDYVALGHLHGAQALTPTMRYSGSPLAYSFSEAPHTKSVTLVDLGAGGVDAVERVTCPVPRRLHAVRGRLTDLLQDPGLAAHEGSWLHVTLTDPVRPREPMAQLRRRFPHVLVLQLEPEGRVGGEEATYTARVGGRSDLEVAEAFVQHVSGGPASTAETGLLAEAFAAVRVAEAGS